MKTKHPEIFYIFIAVLFAGMLFISTYFFKGSGKSFVGVTYAKEYVISAEKPALVKQVVVTPGQAVKSGELLVEISSRSLDMEIDRLENRIVSLHTEQREKHKLAQTSIAYHKAQYSIVIEEIDAQMAELKSKINLNQQLSDELGGAKEGRNKSQDPHMLRLASLEQQKEMHKTALDIRVSDLLQQNETDQVLLQNQISLLDRELTLLLDERKKLSKYATFDGVVENVFVKNNEEIAAFSPMLSVNPAHPSGAIGYFTGTRSQLPLVIGTKVQIMSYEHHKVMYSGKVIGLGAVVELPMILQKSTAVKAFGREVFVEMNAENDFATGEKVLIK